MGGRILDLPSFKILNQGRGEGRTEGEQERKALELENERPCKEIERLKTAKK